MRIYCKECVLMKRYMLGYSIEMHYVGVDSADTAKLRVKNRVEHGGHGIADEDVERRYVETLNNLKIVLPQCNLAAIYDNTEYFRIKRNVSVKENMEKQKHQVSGNLMTKV